MMRLVTIVLAAAPLLPAGSPVLTELQPRGAERGRPFTLTVIGRDIPEGATVSSNMPASFTPAAPAAQDRMRIGAGRVASFLVEPKPDMAPGVYALRITGSTGVSNVLLFSVGIFPETAEEESEPYARPNRNDSIETAQPIQNVPVTINGTLRGPDRDRYRVYGKAGERRVFEVEARRCGSAIDPVLRILNGAGDQLARTDDAAGAGLDARLEFTFPREGYYYVEVHDARFSTQAQNFYRLKMGSYPFADGIFPLGWKRGEPVEVTLFGGNLTVPAKVKIASRDDFDHVPLPASASAPFLFASSGLPELLEPSQQPPVPSVMNGRLLAPGEVDRYRFAVTPGEKLLFELQARELGTSRIEAVLTAYDESGKKLDSAGDKPLPEDVFAVQGTSRTSSDPFLNLTVPEGVREITIAIEDLARRGGPLYGYRLISRRQAEDFSLSVGVAQVNIPAGGSVAVSVIANRHGYDGPIQIAIPGLPKGVTAEGGLIPKEYVDANNARSLNRRGTLVLTAAAGVEMSARDLEVYGEGSLADGSVLRRRATGPGFTISVAGATAQGVVDRQRALTAPWLGFGLPAAIAPSPPATLAVTQVKVTRMDEGDKYEFAYQWRLRDTAARPRGNLAVDVVGARDIRVTDMQRAPGDEPGIMAGTFAVNTSKATDPARYDMIVSGRVQTQGEEAEVVARPLPFIVTGRSETIDVSSAR
jgi:hypothetical protein